MTEKDELREHSFDGIQEYDNDLPLWWVWLFVITIVASVVYPFIYDFGPADFDSETIDAEMTAYNAARQNVTTATVDEASLIRLTADAGALGQGKQVFQTRCMPCHGDNGQGTIGPNLTDDFWIHGGTISEIRNVVMNGVIEKGMVPWKDQLSPAEVNAVVAFVWTLHGTNPANPKEPQGEKVTRN